MFSSGLLLLAAMLMHPVHETVSEVEWNAESGAMEVSLRMSVLDEQWILRRHGKSGESLQQVATRYLRGNFRLDPRKRSDHKAAKQTASKYKWVGRQVEGSHVWWYFEILPAGKKKPTVIEQTMLFDREQTYANRILVLGQVPKFATTLTIRNPSVDLSKRKDDKRNDSTRVETTDR